MDSSTSGMDEHRPVVVVTGFGPFNTYQVNPSWEAVQELNGIWLGEEYELVTVQLPVEYTTVLSRVPQLWEKHHPRLMVHCGVSGIAKDLTLEQCAYNEGYKSQDISGCLPDNGCCVDGASRCLRSAIRMDEVCATVNSAAIGVTAVKSDDPGRYLCDFTYYTSLNLHPERTAFIHVPPLNQPYSAQQLAKGLRVAILAMLQQVAPSNEKHRINVFRENKNHRVVAIS